MSRHAVVVGGTRGLGRATVRALSVSGHCLSVLARRLPDLSDQEKGVSYYQADVCDQHSLEVALDEAVTRSGPLNALILAQRHRGNEQAWDAELQVSLQGSRTVIELCQHRFEKGTFGSIVIISSMFGQLVGRGQPVGYHVAKASVLQLARYYAVQLGPLGIRVNTISPASFVKEESTAFYAGQTQLISFYSRCAPLGELATSEEIADLVEFLCSDKSRCLTGQDFRVDAGLSLLSQESLGRQLADC